MQAFINNAKTAVLLGALMGLFVAVGGAIGQEYLWIGLIFGGLVNLIAYFFSDKIAIAAMRGRELDEQSGGDLYRMVDRLRRRAGLPMPRVYLCPHQAPNAFATGRNPRHAAVAFTQGAIDLLDPAELEGVAAHELAHIKNRDTLISTVAAMIAGTLAFIAQYGFFFMLGRRGSSGGNPLVMFGAIILGAIGAALIRAMISRTREYQADRIGAEIAGSPYGLMSALEKLDNYSKRIPLHQPNPAQNNLFIVEPLAGGGRTLTDLFATHPPTHKRLEALAKLA
ncbi:MAG: protease HtpX [Planctomycetota bacterium]|nr:MAG: protease HtpX [Planctomycetota bacterium]